MLLAVRQIIPDWGLGGKGLCRLYSRNPCKMKMVPFERRGHFCVWLTTYYYAPILCL